MQETPVITKAAFSRLLGVSKPRITQYLALGMPARPDGRLDLDVALAWVHSNILPPPPVGDVTLSDADLERLLDG